MSKRMTLILLLVLTGAALANLATPGLPAGHDTPDHVARIANFYQSLVEGNAIPRWGANLNWGFGHPVLMFLYPLPSYAASLFHSIGFTFVDSVKLVFAVSFIASIAAMYTWAAVSWGSMAGLVAALVYGFAPYRFVDMYVRGAIGEHVAFAFMPLLFLAARQMSKHREQTLWGPVLSLTTAGLLLSHNAVSLMFLPVCTAYLAYLWIWETDRAGWYLRDTVWFGGLGVAAAAFFWVPALLEGKYTLRDIVTSDDWRTRFVDPRQFVYTPWNYGGTDMLPKNLGIIPLIVSAWGIYSFRWARSSADRIFIGGSAVVFFFSLFLMTGASSFVWETVSVLQKFQFPWRLLTVTVFAMAVLGAWSVRHMKHHALISFLLIAATALTTMHMWRAREYVNRQESYYTGIYDSTTDTGESSPIWSTRFMEHRFSDPLEVVTGIADVTQTARSTTTHEYAVLANEKTRLVENTLYFPGWEVFVDGAPVPDVQFQDPQYRGLMTFWVEPGEHTVKVSFGETKLRRVANWTSAIAVLLVMGSLIVWKPQKSDDV